MNEQQLTIVCEKQSNLLLAGWRSDSNKVPRCHRTRNNRAVADLLQFAAWDSATIEQRQDMLICLARKVWAMPKKKDTLAGSEPVPQVAGEVAP